MRKYQVAILLALAILSSCDKDNDYPGWSYFNDMEDSKAYETYSPNRYLPGNKTMTGPVEGTIHTEEHAYNFLKIPEDELKAASIRNPLADSLNLEQATILYDRFCIICHGENGDGQGILFTSKKYPIPPASYHAERAMNKTDGQLFHNIRAGFGVMGAHGPQLSVNETWQLVNYIRHLQKTVTPEDLAKKEITETENSEPAAEMPDSTSTQIDSLPE